MVGISSVRAQHRLAEGDGRLAEHVGALPAEQLVGPHHHGDQQVAGGAAVLAGVALAPQGDGLAVVDAGGDVDLDGLALAHRAGAAAVGTGLVDDLARAAAALGRERLLANTPMGVRCCTCTTPVPWQSGQISGVVPGAQPLPLQVGHCSLRSMVTSFSQPKAASVKVTDTLARMLSPRWGPLRRWSPPAAEAAAEKAAEDVAQVAEVEAAAEAAGAAGAAGRPRRSWGPRRQSRTGRTGPSSPGRTAPRRPR